MKVPQTNNWIRYFETQLDNLAKHYQGSKEEKEAQALIDLSEEQVNKYELAGTLIGGLLLVIKNRKLYRLLGYDSMEALISSERVGGIGRSQAYKLMKVAQHTEPPQLMIAPTLNVPLINTNAPQPMFTADFVSKVGKERAYAVIQKWPKATPERRQELLEAAENADSRGFYETAYGENENASFEVSGDEVICFMNGVGTKVAQMVTTDLIIRSLFLDRLSVVPRAKL